MNFMQETDLINLRTIRQAVEQILKKQTWSKCLCWRRHRIRNGRHELTPLNVVCPGNSPGVLPGYEALLRGLFPTKVVISSVLDGFSPSGVVRELFFDSPPRREMFSVVFVSLTVSSPNVVSGQCPAQVFSCGFFFTVPPGSHAKCRATIFPKKNHYHPTNQGCGLLQNVGFPSEAHCQKKREKRESDFPAGTQKMTQTQRRRKKRIFSYESLFNGKIMNIFEGSWPYSSAKYVQYFFAWIFLRLRLDACKEEENQREMFQAIVPDVYLYINGAWGYASTRDCWLRVRLDGPLPDDFRRSEKKSQQKG